MQTIKLIAVALLIGAASCNSGTSNQSASDSSKMATDTSMKMATDTSHMAMGNMSSPMAMCPVPSGAKVFFKNLKNGQTVTSPVKVDMGVDGMTVDTAGAVKNNSGHFHLLIDAEDSIPYGQVIKKDSTHLHYGKAQTSASLTLAPGKHTIALQFADGIHRSYGAKLATVVTVNVKK